MSLHHKASLLLASLLLALTASASQSLREQLQFAAQMAQDGNWREARHRWEQVARSHPDDPRVLNNLAVAAEAMGDFEIARESYEAATAAAPGDERIASNRDRYERFRRVTEGQAQPPSARQPDPRKSKKGGKSAGKSVRVTVGLPIPPRIDIGDKRTILVASFRSSETALLDINREVVRFFRSEYRKRSDKEILDVTPAPAVPEQTLEDMIANREFWRFLGREYAADVVVSGIVDYRRKDVSGFRDVDSVSQITGQKIRTSKFVESEEFSFVVDVIFMDGASGELLYRDNMKRKIIFLGSQNDPITAFYEMSDAMAADILAIIKPRNRQDFRFIFKR